MPLSWNEIKSRSINFSKEWEGESRERAEKDTFWNEFLNIFGISRRRVATFEKAVKKLNENQGFIDLFWPGTLLVEHKSKGKDLDSAFSQALDYFPGLKEHELPRFIITSDFAEFKVYDLDENQEYQFPLEDLTSNVHLFGFLAGYEKKSFKEEDPVNIDAAYLMGRLHDRLKEIGYTDHALEVYLVRILFCLFADDTNIFERGIFQEYIDLHTKEDGSDLAAHLAQIFQILDTPKEQRLKNIDEALDQFPYVNGQLFAEPLRLASFDSSMRTMLLDACALDWGKISPAIFGSMFQAAMNPEERRDLGAHYTSEKNIQKLIKPLFLDDLRKEFKKAKGNSKKIREFHDKIAQLKFLDPACGCGNFLIITYRELRELEIEILRELNKTGQGFLNIGDIIKVDIDQFHGIEYDEFPARIAEVAMWLMDHQMNMKLSEEFGQYFVRLPLKKSASILNANALRVQWESISQNHDFDYIVGNPPFVGHQWRSKAQMDDMDHVFGKKTKTRRLDYVCAWYLKAAEYIQNRDIHCAYVSTSSICQGEQVPILWKLLFNKLDIKINFAHQSFEWNNEAKGNAGVHVVIIGFSRRESKKKKLYEYETASSDPVVRIVKNINGYLASGSNIFIQSRGAPLHQYPEMFKGSQPTDGGHLILNQEEKNMLIQTEPSSAKYIREYIGGAEFLKGKKRYCLWLKDCKPSELRKMPKTLERVKLVAIARKKSPTKSVREYASYPTLFTQDRQPDTDYLCLPEVSSENREYIPVGFLRSRTICSNKLQIIPDATMFMFGIIMSKLHNVWTSYVSGKLESRISYSPSVYNNFPWPLEPSQKQIEKVEKAAERILELRQEFSESTLADLYNRLTMPPKLKRAHLKLDKAVDLCYRPQPFPDESRRIELLFELYEELVAPQEKAEKV